MVHRMMPIGRNVRYEVSECETGMRALDKRIREQQNKAWITIVHLGREIRNRIHA